MLTRTRLWILGTIPLIGISIAAYAYATTCEPQPVEVLDMQFISVTYGGTPQVDPPEYRLVSGRLTVIGEGKFMEELKLRDGTTPRLIDTRYFDAE